jgi:hypothetical protein
MPCAIQWAPSHSSDCSHRAALTQGARPASRLEMPSTATRSTPGPAVAPGPGAGTGSLSLTRDCGRTSPLPVPGAQWRVTDDDATGGITVPLPPGRLRSASLLRWIMIQVHLCLVCAWTTAVQAAAGLRPGDPGHGRGDEPGREAESRSYQESKTVHGHCGRRGGTPVPGLSLRSSPGDSERRCRGRLRCPGPRSQASAPGGHGRAPADEPEFFFGEAALMMKLPRRHSTPGGGPACTNHNCHLARLGVTGRRIREAPASGLQRSC